MTTEHFNKLADALESNSRFVRHGVSSHGDAELMLQAARILRAAGAADVAALMEMRHLCEKAYSAMLPVGGGSGTMQRYGNAVYDFESALRVAMAQRAGFVMVPIEPTPEMLNAFYDAEYQDDGGDSKFSQAYRSMIAAVPKGTP